MADTQDAPSIAGEVPRDSGSLTETQNAILGLLNSEEEPPKQPEEQTSEEESEEESEDEPLEEAEEESETSDEDEEEESEESDDEVEEEEPDLYAVTIDGEEHEVTFDELIKGYSRQSDYTKKTQALAELRNSFEEAKGRYESELPELQGLKEQYVRNLGEVIEGSLGGLECFNIDWNALREEDREEYLVKREEYREAQDQIKGLQERKSQEDQALNQQAQQNFQHLVVQEHQRMAEQIPEWADKESRGKLASSIKQYAASKGFTEQELSSLVDHRYLLTLMKAMKYDGLQDSDIKSKKLKNKPKVIRSGKGKEKSADSKSRRAAKMKRLQGSGHVDDAASILEDLFNS